jgi:hypothetical protein
MGMKILKKIFFFIFILIVSVLVYIQNQDLNLYKEKLTKIIAHTTGLEARIHGDLKLKILPFISLQVENIELKKSDILSVQGDVNITFVLNKLFTQGFYIKDLVINKAKVLYKIKEKGNNLKNIFNISNLESFSFVDSDFVYINSDAVSQEYESVDCDFSVKRNEISFALKFLVNEQQMRAKGKLFKSADGVLNLSNLNINSNYIEGNVTFNPNSEGSINVKIRDFTKFSEVFLNNYRSPLNVSNKEMINITANCLIKDNKYLGIDKINIISENLKATGAIGLNLDKKKFTSIDLAVENINWDYLFSGWDSARTIVSSTTALGFDELENSGFRINIKNLIYNQQKLNNIKISGKSRGDKIIFDPIIVQLPFNGKLELVGGLANNKFRDAFEGEIFVVGESIEKTFEWLYKGVNRMSDSRYIFRSKIYITPIEFSLSDIDFTTNNSSMRGDISRKISSKGSKIYLDLAMNNFDFDKFIETDSLLKRLAQYRSGLAKENYLISFQPLQSLTSSTHGKLAINNGKFNNMNIEKLHTIVDVTSNMIALQNLEFIADQISIAGKIKVGIENLKPSLEVNVTGDAFDTVKVAKLLNLELLPSLENYRLDRFGGSIDLNVKKVTFDKEQLSNVIVNAKLDNNRVDITQASADLWGGNLNVRGYLTPQIPNFGISFGFSNIDSEKLLTLFLKQNVFEGKISLGGSIYSLKKDEDWIANLKSNFAFVGRAINIKGLDIQSIVDFAREKNIYDQATFDKVVSNALSGGTTYYDKIDGNFQINQGVLQTNSLTFSSSSIGGALAGSFDLKNRLMNVATKINFIPRANAKSIPLTLRMKGHFESPEKTIDASNLSNFLKAN